MISASDITDPNWVGDIARSATGDWGDWGVVLQPGPATNTLGRSGFFLHGGKSPGSAGCIDIGGGMFGDTETDQVLEALKADADGTIPLEVVR